ncbi:MAG: peptidylprolyl isomerase [Sandaracinaceae bacterium]
MTDVIAEKKVVLIHYTLTDPEGEVLDSSKDGPPLPYLHGAGNLVPGLEKALGGRSIGDSFEVEVPADEGYGQRTAELFDIPRKQFPPDADIQPGMDFVMEDDQGQHHPLWVNAVSDEAVTVDPNHPLAGIDLHFAIEVISMREPTDDELDHGHPHGPDGTHQH